MPSPFDCFLVNRGLKTLHVRMERHFKNALAAAKFLEADPRVERVIYPGTDTSPVVVVVGGELEGVSLSLHCNMCYCMLHPPSPPGLPSHPQYEVVKRQCTGCPGMITFYIKGKLEHASTFLQNLKVGLGCREFQSSTVTV